MKNRLFQDGQRGAPTYIYATGVDDVYSSEPILDDLRQRVLTVRNYRQPLLFLDLRDKKHPYVARTKITSVYLKPTRDREEEGGVVRTFLTIQDFHAMIRVDILNFSVFTATIYELFS